MAEILLIRHGESYANKREFAAFGNIDSPLTDRGIEQATDLKEKLKVEFGIDPSSNSKKVAVSRFLRAQQTLQYSGFFDFTVLELIDEADVDREIMAGVDVKKKHREEKWVEPSVKRRAEKLVDNIQSGEFDYDIYFTHGMFIASVLLICEEREIDFNHPFDEKTGYIPLQTGIVSLKINTKST